MQVFAERGPGAQRSLIGRIFARLDDVLLQLQVVLGGFLFGATVIVVLASANLEADDITRFLKLLALEAVFLVMVCVPAVLFAAVRAVWRRRRSRSRGSQNDSTPARKPATDIAKPPWALAWARRQTAALRTRQGLVVSAIAVIADLLAGALLITLSLGHPSGATGLVLAGAAIVVVCAPYVVLALRAGAAIWQTGKRVQESGAIDEPTAWMGTIAVVSFFLPLWAGTYLAAIFLLVFLAGQAPLAPDFVADTTRWMPASLAGRALVVSALIAVCTLVVQTHQPQRFPRATFPVGIGLTADAAFLGRADGQMLLGVCSRRKDGTSAGVEMIRIPEERVPSYRVVDNGYTFYRDDEPTLLSGVFKAIGLPQFRPPVIRRPGSPGPANVCGSKPVDPSWLFERLRAFRPPKAD